MRPFASRRLTNSVLTIAGVAGITAWTVWQDNKLGRADFHTGYVLIGAILFLACYNLRKKLPILPWTTSSAWLQSHIYIGLGSAVVFGLHVGWKVPNGILETSIAVLYCLAFLSGIVGLIWTRTIPPQLARLSEEIIFERTAMIRAQLRDRAQQVVLESVHASGATTLGEFYADRLQGYFESPRRIGYYLWPTNSLRRRLLAELTAVRRYLSEPEQEKSEQLFALVRRRDDLDLQVALQWRLKGWLFVHLGLTYPLVLASCLHGWLAHLFDGGAL